MELKVYLDDDLPVHVAKEIFDSAYYFRNQCPALGSVVVQKTAEIDIDMVKFSDEQSIGREEEVIRFNSLEDNSDNIHLVVPKENLLLKGVGGLALANVVTINPKSTDIWQPVIHGLGHAMGLVQKGMPNYFPNSDELRGGQPGHNCFGPFCIMSTRNIEPELKAGRYASYTTNPSDVFCKDCTNHLHTAKLEELPWYNQIKT